MREIAINYFVVMPLYGIYRFLRILFLSSRIGALVHNVMFYFCGKVVATHPEHKRKFDLLWDAICGRNSFNVWLKRVYRSHPNCWKHFLINIHVRRLVIGSIKRHILSWKGFHVPSTVSLSLNSPKEGCNLKCVHCYEMDHPEDIMPKDVARKIIAEQEKLGIYSMFILGGEAFHYDGILDLAEEFPNTAFWIATNGTLIDEMVVNRVAELGNVVLLFSIEGFKEETDAIRGEGVFEKVMQAIELCKIKKIFFIITATVTRDNFPVVASDRFVKMVVDSRCIGLNYSCYVPVGKSARPELQITDEQSEQLDAFCRDAVKKFPIFTTTGRNGTGRVSDCYAANQYIHILPSGKVEPCPFAHWIDDESNLKNNTILEVMNSRFFRGVRGMNSLGIQGLTSCRASRSNVLKEYFAQLGARPTVY